MGLAFVTSLALCLWVTLWGVGVGGFDSFMIAIVIILIAGTIKSLGKFLPNRSSGGPGDGGW